MDKETYERGLTHCLRCGKPLQKFCMTTGTKVCVECLLKQGKSYEQTGDVREFMKHGTPIIPQYERPD